MSSSAVPDPIRDPAATTGRVRAPRGGGMRFGLFGGAQARRGDGDPARGLRDYVDTCVEAEALGFDSSFLVEHHFSSSHQLKPSASDSRCSEPSARRAAARSIQWTSRSHVTSTSPATPPIRRRRWRGSRKPTPAWSLYRSIRPGAINRTSRPMPARLARLKGARYTAPPTGSLRNSKPCARSVSSTSCFTVESPPDRASDGSPPRSCRHSLAPIERSA